jgi:hypothetical protein
MSRQGGPSSITEDEAMLLGEAARLYPVTVEQLRRSVRMRPAAFDMALRGLVSKGMVDLEPLEDCTYVRPIARVGPAPPIEPLPEDDPAYL